MSLIDDVKAICDRLAPRGWRNLLFSVTNDELDISQGTSADLKAALAKSLATVDRSRSGFEDFHRTANQAIAGGRPSHSLLYHAFASPNVHPAPDGNPSIDRDDYPNLEELDVVENFIYSLVADRADLDDTFVAVFAYQYRTGSRTSHLRHADIAYSRTGVARVGTAGPNYDASRRSFWVLPENGDDALSVLPARYGAYLARRGKPGAAGSVQGGHEGARDEDFVFPVHKLFGGTECLKGQNLSVEFLEYHRNEKLRRIHLLSASDGGLPVPRGFDISKEPYVRDSSNGGDMASLEPVGSTVLVVPKPASTLVRTVSQANAVTNTDQVVYFMVPSSERFTTSTLIISPSGADRLAPEYVNMRHQIDPAGPVHQTPIDLSTTLNEADFQKFMRDGGFPAAHFTDDSCDGGVEAVVTGLPSVMAQRANLTAFSLITAPDFFPLADQIEVETESSIIRTKPLSKGRLPVNPSLTRPSNTSVFAFGHSDLTVTSIVGNFAFGPKTSIKDQINRMVSFLPDAASDVFAPGWDTSRSRESVDSDISYLTSSGLGSPFPEDAKLCAALASFWPAVAPDNGRTFGNEGFGNQLPMLDEELGFHPKHDRVLSGELGSYHGWDGEFGPFFERVGNQFHVNYVAIERSDYVSHALAGRIGASLTAEVQSEELIARHQALLACQRRLVLSVGTVCLVVFRKVNLQTIGPGSPELTGAGYLLEFAELRGGRKTTSELSRVRKSVRKRHICQFGENGVAYKNGSADFVFHPG